MAYVDIKELSGLGQVSVRRFPGCTLTPRFARRLTRGPRRVGLSGLSQFRLPTPLISKVRALVTPLRMPAPLPIVTGAPGKIPSLVIGAPGKIMSPAMMTALRRERIKIPIRPSLWFDSTGIAPTIFERMRAPSGATYKATDVKIVAGADPIVKSLYGAGAGAPLVGGKGMSLKESDPIVAVASTAQGVTLIDEPAPTPVVPTFVEVAAVEPSPFLKYGILAIGAYILYDSFVKSKPKRKRRRR